MFKRYVMCKDMIRSLQERISIAKYPQCTPLVSRQWQLLHRTMLRAETWILVLGRKLLCPSSPGRCSRSCCLPVALLRQKETLASGNLALFLKYSSSSKHSATKLQICTPTSIVPCTFYQVMLLKRKG